METTNYPSYYSILPANVRYDLRLNSNEKLLYWEITCLSWEDWFCYASNNELAHLMDLLPWSISSQLISLENAWCIFIDSKDWQRKIKILKT